MKENVCLSFHHNPNQQIIQEDFVAYLNAYLCNFDLGDKIRISSQWTIWKKIISKIINFKFIFS